MLIKTRAIVISTIRYQEKSLIVRCFTKSHGLRSYFIHNAFSGRSSQKIAYFQPLTILEIEASHKNKGTLETLKEIRLGLAWESLSTDVVKSTIAMFLSEVLNNSIREEETNIDLFEFLETALTWLDHHDEIANFHLILLLEITRFLGFYPDRSNISTPYFEMTEGIFTEFQAISCLSADQSQLLKRLIGLRFGQSQKVFSANERKILVKILLDYYSFHLDGFRHPKSLDVLKEVFS